MDALIASYGDTSSDSESDFHLPIAVSDNPSSPATALPPPPIDLLNPSNTLGTFDYFERNSTSRIRSFPHIEGNYALHVYIPVFIPSERKKELAHFLKKAASLIQGLHVVDIDVPLHMLLKDEENLVQAALGREFHISLGRTVPIRVHQIDSVVAMLRQKLQFQKRFLTYLIDFNKWEVFVNDDKTRTFLSVENTTGGLAEITKQIQAVNEVYKLHNLPQFYKMSTRSKLWIFQLPHHNLDSGSTTSYIHSLGRGGHKSIFKKSGRRRNEDTRPCWRNVTEMHVYMQVQ